MLTAASIVDGIGASEGGRCSGPSPCGRRGWACQAARTRSRWNKGRCGRSSTRRAYGMARPPTCSSALRPCASKRCSTSDIPHGYVWYGGPRRRLRVDFTSDLRREVEEIIHDIRRQLLAAILPEAPNDARCAECQLQNHCLPWIDERSPKGKQIHDQRSYSDALPEHGLRPRPSSPGEASPRFPSGILARRQSTDSLGSHRFGRHAGQRADHQPGIGSLRATRRPGRCVEDERSGSVCRWGADRRQRPLANGAVSGRLQMPLIR